MIIFIRIPLFLSLFLMSVAYGGVVKTTLPEFKWLTEKITTEKYKVSSLLSGHEDPHFVDVTPSMIFKVKKTQMVIMNGLALESTWLPKVIETAGMSNSKDFLCDASKNISSLGIKENIDRSHGDVHPEGNPHYSYSPKQMLKASEAIFDCLVKKYPKDKELFSKNFYALKQELIELDKKVNNLVNKVSNIKIMTYHKEFLYFCHDYQVQCMGDVEKIPGVLPSGAHLLKKSKFAKKNRIDFVLATDTNPVKILKKFKEIANVPYYQIEAHMNEGISKYEDFVLQIPQLFLKTLDDKNKAR